MTDEKSLKSARRRLHVSSTLPFKVHLENNTIAAFVIARFAITTDLHQNALVEIWIQVVRAIYMRTTRDTTMWTYTIYLFISPTSTD